jgi:flagellar hook-associated protein 2
MKKIDFGGTAGQTRRSGINSGVDTEAMIKAEMEKREKPINLDRDKVVFNNEKIQALTQLKTLVSEFQDSLASLKGAQNFLDTPSALQAKLVNLSSTTAEDPNKFIVISAASDATLGAFDLQINQVAQNKIMTTVGFSSSTFSATNIVGNPVNTNLFSPGTFQINGQNITVQQDDSLSTIMGNINAISSATKVTAQIISPSSGSYKLLIQSGVTGLANDIVITDASNVLNNIITGGAILQPAQDAIFTYNNIAVQRPTNIISDFIDGVTFNLLKPTKTTIYTPSPTQQYFQINALITNDIETAANAIQNFVDSYNSLNKFIAQQQAVDGDGKYYPNAKIRNDYYISNLATNISLIASQVAYLSEVTGNFGITSIDEVPPNPYTGEPQYNNLLALSRAALENALRNNFDAVCSHFEYRLIGAPSAIELYKHGDGILNGALSINIDVTKSASQIVTATFNGASVNMQFIPTDQNDLTKGGLIVGIPGSFMNDYEFGYSGLGSDNISVTIQCGVADRLYSLVNNATASHSGNSPLQTSIDSLIKENHDKNNSIKRQERELESHKDQLVKKYAKMEAQVAKANATIAMIEAQQKAMNKS